MALTHDDLTQLTSAMRDVMKEEVPKSLEPLATALKQDLDKLDRSLKSMEAGVDGVRRYVWDKTATKEDLAGLETRLPTRKQIEDLSTTTDTYLKKTETWHDEQEVLRASHARVKKVLIKKGIASEHELAA